MIVGLTGGIGSGKSTVAQYFRDCGVMVIDTDEIARQLLEPDQPILKDVVQHFGPEILQKDGSLNRALLRSIVFESEHERRWLEALLHPLIKAEILPYAERKMANTQKNNPYFVVEIPLLIEAHFEDVVNRILVVDCPSDLQIERIQKRDATPIDVIQKIIQSQADRGLRLRKADDVIENMGNRDDLKTKVLALHHYYTELSK